MPKTKKFSQLTDAARRDPIRRTRIDAARKGTGRVVIDYSSLEQLDGILARLRRK